MKIRLIGSVVTTLFILTSCQSENNDDAQSKRNTNDSYMQVKNSEQSQQSQKQQPSRQDIADHLANIASDVPSVNSASAIVAGPYALVGIDVDKELDRSRVGTIKYTVAEVLQHDDYGKTAVVVADGDVLERIRSMRQHIQDGQPVQGVIEEISAIVGRYMPDLPTPEKKPQKPDQNKEMLDDNDKEDKENLDKIERDQSKTE